jgi:hypothetical protein
MAVPIASATTVLTVRARPVRMRVATVLADVPAEEVLGRAEVTRCLSSWRAAATRLKPRASTSLG